MLATQYPCFFCGKEFIADNSWPITAYCKDCKDPKNKDKYKSPFMAELIYDCKKREKRL